jgi:hypothetical protein
MEEWVERVSSHNRDEALTSFEKWKKEHQEWYHRLNDDDILLRIGRTKEEENSIQLSSQENNRRARLE